VGAHERSSTGTGTGTTHGWIASVPVASLEEAGAAGVTAATVSGCPASVPVASVDDTLGHPRHPRRRDHRLAVQDPEACLQHPGDWAPGAHERNDVVALADELGNDVGERARDCRPSQGGASRSIGSLGAASRGAHHAGHRRSCAIGRELACRARQLLTRTTTSRAPRRARVTSAGSFWGLSSSASQGAGVHQGPPILGPVARRWTPWDVASSMVGRGLRFESGRGLSGVSSSLPAGQPFI
jgi:hypothetical protein